MYITNYLSVSLPVQTDKIAKFPYDDSGLSIFWCCYAFSSFSCVYVLSRTER